MKRFLKNNLIIIGLCLGFISCSSEQKYVETENLHGELMVTDSLNAGANPSILADSVWLLRSFSNKFNTNVSVQKGDSLKTKTLAFMRGAGHGEYDKTAFAVSSDKSLYVLNCSSNGNKIYSLSRVAQAKWLNGNYKIDARFNKEDLIKRIQRIADYADRIHLTNEDAVSLVQRLKNELPYNTLFYLDPPYYVKGKGLYLNYYNDTDHQNIANTISEIANCKWIVSYDNVPFITSLYSKYRQQCFELNYSASNSGKGKEIMVFCDGIVIPKHKLFNHSTK